jgi:AraC-like DNA-binding protein
VVGDGNRPTRGGNVHALRARRKVEVEVDVTMVYRELLPHPALRPFVDRFWILTAAASAGPRRILPDGCIDMIVDVDPDSDGFGQATAVGTMTRAMLFHPRTRVCSAAVRFRPGGAAPFLRLPADELTDRVLDAGDAGARWIAADAGEVPADPRAAVAALERRLIARLDAIPAPDRAVAHAVGRLFAAAPPPIAELGRELGWSRQHLARRFRAEIGVGPKQLARVARLQRAVDRLQSGAGGALTLAGTAVDLGYFDQAHMARDFREMAGVAPRDVRETRGSIFPIRSLFAPPGSSP